MCKYEPKLVGFSILTIVLYRCFIDFSFTRHAITAFTEVYAKVPVIFILICYIFFYIFCSTASTIEDSLPRLQDKYLLTNFVIC